MSITKTAEAVKYFEFAIEEMKEALKVKIEQDEEYLKFRQELYEKYHCSFIYFSGTMEFEFYSADKEVNTFFTITKSGEIKFNTDNTFDGIEDVAKEALRIISKL